MVEENSAAVDSAELGCLARRSLIDELNGAAWHIQMPSEIVIVGSIAAAEHVNEPFTEGQQGGKTKSILCTTICKAQKIGVT